MQVTRETGNDMVLCGSIGNRPFHVSKVHRLKIHTYHINWLLQTVQTARAGWWWAVSHCMNQMSGSKYILRTSRTAYRLLLWSGGRVMWPPILCVLGFNGQRDNAGDALRLLLLLGWVEANWGKAASREFDGVAGKWKVLFFCILVFLYSSIFAIIQFSSFFFALPDYGTCKKLGMCPDVLGDRQQKGRTSLSITNPDFLLPRQGKTLDRPAPMGHRRGPVIHESDHSVPLLVIGNPIPPLRLWP